MNSTEKQYTIETTAANWIYVLAELKTIWSGLIGEEDAITAGEYISDAYRDLSDILNPVIWTDKKIAGTVDRYVNYRGRLTALDLKTGQHDPSSFSVVDNTPDGFTDNSLIEVSGITEIIFNIIENVLPDDEYTTGAGEVSR